MDLPGEGGRGGTSVGLKVWTCQVRGAVVVLGGLKAGGRLLACAGYASGEVHVRDL